MGNHLKLARGRAEKRPVMSVMGLHFTLFCRHSPLLLLGRRKETTVCLVFQKEVCKRGLPVSSEEAWVKSMCVSLSPHPKTRSWLPPCYGGTALPSFDKTQMAPFRGRSRGMLVVHRPRLPSCLMAVRSMASHINSDEMV